MKVTWESHEGEIGPILALFEDLLKNFRYYESLIKVSQKSHENDS